MPNNSTGLLQKERPKYKNFDAEIYLGKNILTIINVNAINEEEAVKEAGRSLRIAIKETKPKNLPNIDA